MPDAIGWKKACHSVLVECKVSRADFLADRGKPFRQNPETGVGCERYYLSPRDLIRDRGAAGGVGTAGGVRLQNRAAQGVDEESSLAAGFQNEMNLLLASLRRVEVRIEPQSITDFLKWKNRMAEYNRGQLPEGLAGGKKKRTDFCWVRRRLKPGWRSCYQQKETGRFARFRQRWLRCGYIASRRGLARRFSRAWFASALASRTSKVFKRSEDATQKMEQTPGQNWN